MVPPGNMGLLLCFQHGAAAEAALRRQGSFYHFSAVFFDRAATDKGEGDATVVGLAGQRAH